MTAPGAARPAAAEGAHAAANGQVGASSAATSSANGYSDIGDVSVGQLISDVSRDLSTLMRQEVELAKAEIKTEVSKAGKAAGMFGGAGFAGYMVLLFLSCALWWGLENVMDAGWAALIVAALWGVIGAVLFVTGRGEMRSVNPTPERTVETAKQVPSAFKTN
jgi:hypothetical protein